MRLRGVWILKEDTTDSYYCMVCTTGRCTKWPALVRSVHSDLAVCRHFSRFLSPSLPPINRNLTKLAAFLLAQPHHYPDRMASSLLLRHSGSFAKARFRRRLVASAKGLSLETSESGSSSWRAGSFLGSTARSLVTSLSDQEREDANTSTKASWLRDLKANPALQRHHVSMFESGTQAFQLSDHVPITTSHVQLSRAIQLEPPSTGSVVRPGSCLRHLIARERAASAIGIRALSTWTPAGTHIHSNVLLSRIPMPSNPYQCSSFSTNSDGSRTRDPRIVRGGIRKTKIPTPSSGPNQQPMKPEDMIEEINKKSKTVVLPAVVSGLKAVLRFLLHLPKNIFFYVTHPSEVKEWWSRMKKTIKDEIDHYWVGTKVRNFDVGDCSVLFLPYSKSKNYPCDESYSGQISRRQGICFDVHYGGLHSPAENESSF